MFFGREAEGVARDGSRASRARSFVSSTLPRYASRTRTVANVEKYLQSRRGDVHDTRPWAPFAYVNRRLTELVGSLLSGAGAPDGGSVLDYGCADAPYRWLLP
jgi:hypothetical protein